MSDELFINPKVMLLMPGLIEPFKKACIAAAAGEGKTLAAWLPTLGVQDMHDIVGQCALAAADENALNLLCLFSILLANQEGLIVSSSDSLSDLVTNLNLYIQSELICRQKLATLPYSKITIESFTPEHLVLTDLGRQLGVTVSMRRSER